MNEKKLKEEAEKIVDAFISLSIGKEPHLLSNTVFKKLADHPNFELIKQEIVNYLSWFTGKVVDKNEIKRLSDFRFRIYELYQNGL